MRRLLVLLLLDVRGADHEGGGSRRADREWHGCLWPLKHKPWLAVDRHIALRFWAGCVHARAQCGTGVCSVLRDLNSHIETGSLLLDHHVTLSLYRLFSGVCLRVQGNHLLRLLRQCLVHLPPLTRHLFDVVVQSHGLGVARDERGRREGEPSGVLCGLGNQLRAELLKQPRS